MSSGTQAAARAVQPILGPRTAVLSLQNGVIKDDILKRELGESNGHGRCRLRRHHHRAPRCHSPDRNLAASSLRRIRRYTRSARANELLEGISEAGHKPSSRTTSAGRCGEVCVSLSVFPAARSRCVFPSDPSVRISKHACLPARAHAGNRSGRPAHGVKLPENYAAQRLGFCRRRCARH